MRATLLLLAALPIPATAQWQLLDAHTTADLRGIDNVGHGIVWASGTNGTVLRSEDNGATWQTCPTPPNAEKLDFRGIQAFDANTAIVMSSGKGDLSRLYKTIDGCKTWTLEFTNPDKEGFWDALQIDPTGDALVLGDPVGGYFKFFCKIDDDAKWAECITGRPVRALKSEAVFAASNSSLIDHKNIEEDGPTFFVTGGPSGSRIFQMSFSKNCTKRPGCAPFFIATILPFFPKAESAGIFSIAEGLNYSVVAVGGDYLKPNVAIGTAAFITGKRWQPATTPPHGYRSAVAYDALTKTWITVGPNGTDISTDDGRNWRALKPSATDTPDADKSWNALSLPFVVGPKGRIGILNPTALKPNP